MSSTLSVSGSLAWKAARHELGDSNEKKEGDVGKDGERRGTQSFFVESFYPSSRMDDLTITVQSPNPSTTPSTAPKSHPECVTVSGVPCATTMTNGVSVVVVDEASGCILQSKAFTQWSSAGSFLDIVLNGRIVAICSIRDEKPDGRKSESFVEDSTSKHFSRLGGFNLDTATTSTETYFFFVGQLNYHPKWASGLETSDSKQAMKVTIHIAVSSPPKARLRSETSTVPRNVATRLPESIMPLKTQLVASNFQKRVAFRYCGRRLIDVKMRSRPVDVKMRSFVQSMLVGANKRGKDEKISY